MAKLRTQSITDKFSRLLKKAVQTGMPYHDLMVVVANILRDHSVHPETAIELMYEASEKVTRRPPSTGEIERIVGWSYRNNSTLPLKGWEKPNIGAKMDQNIIAAWASKGDLKALMRRSAPVPPKPETILEELYADDDLLHISPDVFQDKIRPRKEWVADGLQDMQYFCPCLFKERDKGRVAENVGSRKFLVFETDQMPKKWNAQVGLIERLGQELPLRMVIYSGNKSLHSFFECIPNKERIQKFHDLVITLGGDQSVLRPSQMVRFPWGRNTKTGKTQKVVFYDDRHDRR